MSSATTLQNSHRTHESIHTMKRLTNQPIRDVWRWMRCLVRDHSWTDGCRVKTSNEEWRLQFCECGKSRVKPNSRISNENAKCPATEQGEVSSD